MKIDYVLLGFGVASIIVGFVLIGLGSTPISLWSKDNFVYVTGVMILLLGILIGSLGFLRYWKRREEASRTS